MAKLVIVLSVLFSIHPWPTTVGSDPGLRVSREDAKLESNPQETGTVQAETLAEQDSVRNGPLEDGHLRHSPENMEAANDAAPRKIKRKLAAGIVGVLALLAVLATFVKLPKEPETSEQPDTVDGLLDDGASEKLKEGEESERQPEKEKEYETKDHLVDLIVKKLKKVKSSFSAPRKPRYYDPWTYEDWINTKRGGEPQDLAKPFDATPVDDGLIGLPSNDEEFPRIPRQAPLYTFPPETPPKAPEVSHAARKLPTRPPPEGYDEVDAPPKRTDERSHADQNAPPQKKRPPSEHEGDNERRQRPVPPSRPNAMFDVTPPMNRRPPSDDGGDIESRRQPVPPSRPNAMFDVTPPMNRRPPSDDEGDIESRRQPGQSRRPNAAPPVVPPSRPNAAFDVTPPQNRRPPSDDEKNTD